MFEESKQSIFSNFESSAPRNQSDAISERWEFLCEKFLPVHSENSIWRYNRSSSPTEPSQGWKLHISATVADAGRLFERIVSFLIDEKVLFKAPKTLEELSHINCGLRYGYHQVGKFMTIYPSTLKKAVKIAETLHQKTVDFFPVQIPFDEQYKPESSVFYRYGAFTNIEIADKDGNKFLAIKNQNGEYIPDNRFKAVPEWLKNPFPHKKKAKTFQHTPLGKTYKIFKAIVQRGKGGTYRAIDFSENNVRQCVVKEGRLNGELSLNGQDGYALVKNEFEVLKVLKEKYDAVPQVFSSFEVFGNFYFAMEYVDGICLSHLMKLRKRRFSVKQVIEIAFEILCVIEKIHQAGWVWNDCKPANLIITADGNLRPIDFENSFRIDGSARFEWQTVGFTKSTGIASHKSTDYDIYAFGAVIYFLLSGRLYNSEAPVLLKKMRRGIPPSLNNLVEKMLTANDLDLDEIKNGIERLKLSLKSDF